MHREHIHDKIAENYFIMRFVILELHWGGGGADDQNFKILKVLYTKFIAYILAYHTSCFSLLYRPIII